MARQNQVKRLIRYRRPKKETWRQRRKNGKSKELTGDKKRKQSNEKLDKNKNKRQNGGSWCQRRRRGRRRELREDKKKIQNQIKR